MVILFPKFIDLFPEGFVLVEEPDEGTGRYVQEIRRRRKSCFVMIKYVENQFYKKGIPLILPVDFQVLIDVVLQRGRDSDSGRIDVVTNGSGVFPAKFFEGNFPVLLL